MAPSLECLGLVPRSICAPHFNRVFPAGWLKRGFLPPGWTLIGIDEQTALVHRGGSWEVRGRGRVSILGEEFNPRRHTTGELAGRESV
jgi:cyanophycinase-like exopeptidase